MEEFESLANSIQFKRLNLKAQSYLFCSFDSLCLMLAVKRYIENENNLSLDLEKPISDIVVLKKASAQDINSLFVNASTAPVFLKHKYYIIENAQDISDAAANKLLKTLEEPPLHLKIFVLCNDEFEIKPTIRSRCQILRLNNLTLTHPDPLIDEMHLNSLERLKKAKERAYDAPFKVALNTLLFLRKSTQIAAHISFFNGERDALYEIICAMEMLINDCKLYLSGLDIRLRSYRADIIKIASYFGLDCLIRLDEVMINAKKRLANSGNLNSIADQLLFSILSTRQKYNN